MDTLRLYVPYMGIAIIIGCMFASGLEIRTLFGTISRGKKTTGTIRRKNGRAGFTTDIEYDDAEGRIRTGTLLSCSLEGKEAEDGQKVEIAYLKKGNRYYISAVSRQAYRLAWKAAIIMAVLCIASIGVLVLMI